MVKVDKTQDLIDALDDGAPTALDTLNELAAAIGDDPNYATTITNALAGKAGISDAIALDFFYAN